jgi:hypothetical protein
LILKIATPVRSPERLSRDCDGQYHNAIDRA